jgi:signal transduction histidine kinase
VSVTFQDVYLPLLAVGGEAAVVHVGCGKEAKTTRGRLRELGWSAAMIGLTAFVVSTVTSMNYGDHPLWLSGVPLLTALVLVLRPRLARRIVPAAMIVLGLYGFMIARLASFYGPQYSYGLAETGGGSGDGLYLVLPQAYAFLVAGGWLAWRSGGPRVLPLLGGLRRTSVPGQASALLLLPVAIMAAALVSPNLWVGGSVVGILGTVLVLAATGEVIRRWPEIAAGLTAMTLILLGFVGLYLAVAYRHGHWGLPTTANDQGGTILYGLLDVTNHSMAYLAAAPGVACVALGTWLVPRTLPKALDALGVSSGADLRHRVQRLTESRAVAVDTAAADLRRLERDLHDGAQARLVALGMSLRGVERLIPTSPDAALALVAEARQSSAMALIELRELVRGVHPPVLADRGLGDAIRALALDSPLRIDTDIQLPGRLPAPVETTCYFAVAEVLTNAAKHSGARDARIAAEHTGGLLRICITDFGMGGADPALGTGLTGVERRLATFDGVLAVSSPPGGPTMVVIEVPCAMAPLAVTATS